MNDKWKIQVGSPEILQKPIYEGLSAGSVSLNKCVPKKSTLNLTFVHTNSTVEASFSKYCISRRDARIELVFEVQEF